MSPEIEPKESYWSRWNSSSFDQNGCWAFEYNFVNAINNSFKNNIFPSNAKEACVKPQDKKTEDKHYISNYRPVSILTTFSKIYEMFGKKLLVSNIEEFFHFFSNI